MCESIIDALLQWRTPQQQRGSVIALTNTFVFAGVLAGSLAVGFLSGLELGARAINLSAAQFRKQFAPSAAGADAVQSWLAGQGFNVVYTPSNKHYLSVEGTVAQASAAFGTSFSGCRPRPRA